MVDQVVISGTRTTAKLTPATITPTIIIGIGGAGGEVLLRLRHRFWEQYGALENFPLVSYLWIDTDLTEKSLPTELFPPAVQFRPSEKIMATITDLARVTANLKEYPYLKPWFYEGLSQLTTLTAGSHQHRIYGRLGFFEHYHTLRQALQNAGAQISKAENRPLMWDQHQLAFTTTNQINVYLICALGGGTGSGMFLDTAFLVKDIFSSQLFNSVGFLLLPRLFGGELPRAFANSYAALKELEHYNQGNHFEVEWPDRIVRQFAPPVFDYCYLIDNVNASEKLIDQQSKSLLLNMLAESIFQDFSSTEFADYKRGLRSSLSQFLSDRLASQHWSASGQVVVDKQFTCRYSALGLSSIKLPLDRIKLACSYKLALTVVEQWGSLTGETYNAKLLTKAVLDQFLPAAELYEGTAPFLSSDTPAASAPQRHDLLDFLNSIEPTSTASLANQIDRWVREIVRQAHDHLAKPSPVTPASGAACSLRQFLTTALEPPPHQTITEHKPADSQHWSAYAQIIRARQQQLTQKGKQTLARETINWLHQPGQKVGYVIALLKQVVFVFTDPGHHYRARFLAEAAKLARRAEDSWQALQNLLLEIETHQHRRNWDGRKKRILAHDLQQFEPLAAQYLKTVLNQQLHLAAAAAVEEWIQFIGWRDPATVARPLDPTTAPEVPESPYQASLIGRLYLLSNDLLDLKNQLQAKWEHLADPNSDTFSLILYDRDDLEQQYYSRYLSATAESEATTLTTATIGAQILEQLLAQLQVTILDLPDKIAHGGLDPIEQQIINLTSKFFSKLDQDSDVITALWDKYPCEEDRQAQLHTAYHNAHFWLYNSNLAYQWGLTSHNLLTRPNLAAEHPQPIDVDPPTFSRHQVLIGMPKVSNSKLTTALQQLLRQQFPLPGQPTPTLLSLSDSQQIIFYQEISGIAISFADEIYHLEQHYQGRQLSEELHTDRREIKFQDITLLNDEAGKVLESIYECFLWGIMLDCIHPIADGQQIIYQYIEAIGLNQQRQILGTLAQALRRLQQDVLGRQYLQQQIQQRQEFLQHHFHYLLQYNALLCWYAQNKYPAQEIISADGRIYIEQATFCRLISREIQRVAGYLNANLTDLNTEVQQQLQLIEQFTQLLPDGHRKISFSET